MTRSAPRLAGVPDALVVNTPPPQGERRVRDRAFAPWTVDEVTSWDVTTDVVVVGYGAAGASAAIEARRAGADVLVVEAAGAAGGSSALAGGLIYLGGGTAIQHACGFEDSAEEMARFLEAACGPGADVNKIEVYAEQSVAHFEWLVSCGVPFKAEFWSELTLEPWNDAGLMFCGGETAHPFDQIARPAPRGHSPQVASTSVEGRAGGWLLMEALASTAAGAGAEVMTDTSVDRLVVEHDRVVGVVARRYGHQQAVAARRGVVLATGSFSFDDELVADHAPQLSDTGKIGVDRHDGRALRMAVACGAATKHMDAGEATIGVPPALFVPGIVVNGAGQRFVNEDTYPGRIGQHAVYRQDKDVYVVFDEEIYEAEPRFRGDVLPDWISESVAGLEAEVGFPEGSLEATIELYNRHAERGSDPLFHKKPRWLKPLRSPFAAVATAGHYRTFTLGGLVTTVTGEVVDVGGDPIPGLFAAGRVSSGIPAWGYISGTSLGDSTFFGRLAGAEAARAQG